MECSTLLVLRGVTQSWRISWTRPGTLQPRRGPEGDLARGRGGSAEGLESEGAASGVAKVKPTTVKGGRAWAVKERRGEFWRYGETPEASDTRERWYFWATH